MTYDRGTGGRSDSTAYEGGATLYDAYWVTLLFPVTGFKPPGGTQVYASHWWVPLTDPPEKLPQGTYTVYFEETIRGPMTGLDGIYDGPEAPYHPEPGTNVTAPYTFTVGPPAP